MSEQSRRRGPYPAEVRERAVRMVFDHQHEYPSQWKAIESISAKLSINHETLRIWVRRAETDAGDRPGLRSDERAGMRELERENKELRRAIEMALFVYGADKIWSQLNREGIRVARCTVERLMRSEGLSGARRGKAFTITTERDDRLSRPADLVERQFWAPAPDRLWVADLTYVKTHVGWVYVAFIIDVYSRMIVGWQASRSLRSDLAIDALEMAVWNRRRADRTLGQLVHHSDMGVQYLSIRYSERLADNDIVASVGSKGDSFDCEITGGVSSSGLTLATTGR